MLLLSTHSGSDEHPVHVRVDDLPEEERTLVRETLRLIKAMSGRREVALVMVVIAVFLGCFGMIPILSDYIPKLSFMAFLVGIAAGGAVFGFPVWVITRAIVNRRHAIDAIRIRNCGTLSARCSDLVHEYSAVNPWFARALTSRTTQTVTA